MPDNNEVVEQLSERGLVLARGCQTLSIVTQEDANKASEILVGWRSFKEEWEKYWEGPLRPLREAEAEIRTKRDTFLKAVEPAIKDLTSRLAAWKQAEGEKYRKAKEEAERKEWERRQAARAGEAPEGFEDAAAAIIPIVQPEAPQLQGLSTRPNWKYRVVDLDKVPNQYLKLVIDDEAVKSEIKISKGNASIPGIEIWNEPIMVRRAK